MTRLFGKFPRAAAIAVILAVVSNSVEAADKTVRVGFQKYGAFLLLKARGLLEKNLAPLGYSVSWTEFPGGPQLLEALNVGALDFGITGEAPPIFAQAAGAPLVYVGNEPPAPRAEAILVPKDSPLHNVADLKGKKIALNKGSNVHYLLVKALEKAGLKYSEVNAVFLAPAHARAAFEHGSVDAWVIWDPFQAAAELTLEARTLANGEGGVAANRQFYLGEQKFVSANQPAVEAILASIKEIDDRAKDNTDQAANELSPQVGIPAPILKLALSRQSWGVRPITADVAADQQKIADAFLALGLIPKPVKIDDALRANGS
jgi:sulfonate transport system substrate-binding protein